MYPLSSLPSLPSLFISHVSLREARLNGGNTLELIQVVEPCYSAAFTTLFLLLPCGATCYMSSAVTSQREALAIHFANINDITVAYDSEYLSLSVTYATYSHDRLYKSDLRLGPDSRPRLITRAMRSIQIIIPT